MRVEVLNKEQLAEFLGVSEKTIQNRVTVGGLLPPSFKLPNHRARLWRKSDVEAWVNQLADEAIKEEQRQQDKFREMKGVVRRGRPLKQRIQS